MHGVQPQNLCPIVVWTTSIPYGIPFVPHPPPFLGQFLYVPVLDSFMWIPSPHIVPLAQPCQFCASFTCPCHTPTGHTLPIRTYAAPPPTAACPAPHYRTHTAPQHFPTRPDAYPAACPPHPTCYYTPAATLAATTQRLPQPCPCLPAAHCLPTHALTLPACPCLGSTFTAGSILSHWVKHTHLKLPCHFGVALCYTGRERRGAGPGRLQLYRGRDVRATPYHLPAWLNGGRTAPNHYTVSVRLPRGRFCGQRRLPGTLQPLTVLTGFPHTVLPICVRRYAALTLREHIRLAGVLPPLLTRTPYSEHTLAVAHCLFPVIMTIAVVILLPCTLCGLPFCPMCQPPFLTGPHTLRGRSVVSASSTSCRHRLLYIPVTCPSLGSFYLALSPGTARRASPLYLSLAHHTTFIWHRAAWAYMVHHTCTAQHPNRG